MIPEQSLGCHEKRQRGVCFEHFKSRPVINDEDFVNLPSSREQAGTLNWRGFDKIRTVAVIPLRPT